MQKLHCKIMNRLLGAFSVSETGLYINTSNEFWLPAKGQEISEDFFIVLNFSKKNVCTFLIRPLDIETRAEIYLVTSLLSNQYVQRVYSKFPAKKLLYVTK